MRLDVAPEKMSIVLLHVRANRDSPVSMATTHMQWLHGRGGHQSTDCTGCGPNVSLGVQLGSSIRARTKMRAKVNVRPRPLVQTNQHEASEDDTTNKKKHCAKAEKN